MLVLSYTDESDSSGPWGTKEGTEPLQAGKMFPKQQDLPVPPATCVPRPPKAAFPSPLPALWPRGLIPLVRIEEVQCVSFLPPHWGIDSVAPSLGHLGPAVGLADASRRSVL